MPVNIGDNRLIEQGIARITEEDAERLSRHRVEAGDIIYSRRGDVERRALIRPEHEGWLCGTGCLKVRLGKGGVDPTFASYYLGHPDVRSWIARHAIGATMPNLNTAIIEAVPFVVPPLVEQQAIAGILGALDDKIELNRRMNETLEAMARAIFKSWFVDFDPVRAKAAVWREHPNWTDEKVSRAACPNLKPDIAVLFPDAFEDSELGEVPKGWGVVPFAATVDILGGGTPKTSVPEYWDGDIPWYAVGDAPSASDVYVIDTKKKITKAGVENSATQVLPTGTTIISARGTVGKLALTGVPMAMNQTCYGLRAKQGGSLHFTFFSTHSLVSTLQQRTHGSVFDTITRDTLNDAKAALPSPALVQRFEAMVSPLMGRLLNSLWHSRTLAAIRDALLPRLMSGEMRLPAAFRDAATQAAEKQAENCARGRR